MRVKRRLLFLNCLKLRLVTSKYKKGIIVHTLGIKIPFLSKFWKGINIPIKDIFRGYKNLPLIPYENYSAAN